MTLKEFDEFQTILFREASVLTKSKGIEYSGAADRFANFNRLAKQLEIDRLVVAQVYLTKHLDAINSFIKTKETKSTESIRSRFIDAINYLSLMAAMVAETEKLTTINDLLKDDPSQTHMEEMVNRFKKDK